MNLKDVRITEGFWKKRKEINNKISFYAILKTFEDSGRIRSLTKDLKRVMLGIKGVENFDNLALTQFLLPRIALISPL